MEWYYYGSMGLMVVLALIFMVIIITKVKNYNKSVDNRCNAAFGKDVLTGETYTAPTGITLSAKDRAELIDIVDRVKTYYQTYFIWSGISFTLNVTSVFFSVITLLTVLTNDPESKVGPACAIVTILGVLMVLILVIVAPQKRYPEYLDAWHTAEFSLKKKINPDAAKTDDSWANIHQKIDKALVSDKQ